MRILLAMKIFKTRTRVRYAETDAAGIVYYNCYFVYFELGRIEMFRELGLPYDWRLPIAETYCKYLASARFDDCLEIHTFLQQVRSKGFRLGCRVFRMAEQGQGSAAVNEPELLVEGYTAMVTVGQERRPVALPEQFSRVFAEIT